MSLKRFYVLFAYFAIASCASAEAPTTPQKPKSIEQAIVFVCGVVKAPGFSCKLLRALIKVESSYNPLAERFEPKLNTSSIGLTQVLGTTARRWGVGESELTDPETSVFLGALILRDCLKYEHGEVRYALACYNAGMRKKRRYPAAAMKYAGRVMRSTRTF